MRAGCPTRGNLAGEVPARVRGSVLAVVLVGFAVRLIAFAAAADAPLVLDEASYRLRAEALLDGQGFVGSYQSWVGHEGRPIDLPQYPGAWQPPGQTLWLAAALALGDRSVAAARFGQVLLGSLAVFLVYLLGRAWFGHRQGLVAAWLCALYPNLIAYSHYLWSEPLFTALLLSALWLVTRRAGAPGAGDALAAGALLGLAALTRAAALYMLPLVAGWLLVARRAHPHAARRAAALLVAAAFVVVLPWSVRNTRLHDGFVLIETNAPYNLWRGNGPDSFAGRDDPGTARYAWPFDGIPITPVGNRTARRLVEETKLALEKPAPTDIEIMQHARRAASEEIRARPGTFVARIPTRLVDLWNPTSFLLRHLRIGAYGAVPAPLEAALSIASVLSYAAVMALAGIGIWMTRRRPETWLVVLFALLLSVMSAASFGLTRFRVPWMPLAMLMAALPLATLWERRRGAASAAGVAFGALLLAGCTPSPEPAGPNLLWVVWDTVRADRTGLYGHDAPTTPHLDTWATKGRVFEDVVSPAGYTLPAHASMFTGLLPSEHCTDNENQRLDDRFETLAERLDAAGWRTFLFSANPHVTASPSRNLAQGFATTEHPWSERWIEEARRLTREKIDPEDRSSELPDRLESGALTAWTLKASGELAQRAVIDWLESTDSERPWFVFVNYMEAHRPLIPPRRYRELMLEPAAVEHSYAVDRSWLPMWEYTFGLGDYSRAELAVTRATYDATIRQLDDLFANLLSALEERGYLEDTVVVLTADHGELLGEHHMLDHQYALHEPLLRVPLVIHAPGRVEPGREGRPVSTLDLFPTLLGLMGLDAPEDGAAKDLLAPDAARTRIAEDPSGARVGLSQVLAAHPGWNPSRFQRSQRALLDGDWKYLWASDGRDALYDLGTDPGELHDRSAEDPERTAQLRAALEAELSALARCEPTGEKGPELSPEEASLLRELGYLAPEEREP